MYGHRQIIIDHCRLSKTMNDCGLCVGLGFRSLWIAEMAVPRTGKEVLHIACIARFYFGRIIFVYDLCTVILMLIFIAPSYYRPALIAVCGSFRLALHRALYLAKSGSEPLPFLGVFAEQVCVLSCPQIQVAKRVYFSVWRSQRPFYCMDVAIEWAV